MPIWSPATWVPWMPWLGVGYFSWDALYTTLSDSRKVLFSSVYLVIYLVASYWQRQVTKIVPVPYLDEIFHIPQAQAYCTGDFHIWDPKLTTPPGLYVFATLFGNLGGIRTCNVYTLRFFNTLVLIASMAYASDCRALIMRAWKREPKDKQEDFGLLSPSVMHTAFNIALFPPLFFFSALFYTDVLSTCLVLRMYRLFLQRQGSVWIYSAGFMALTMRQTNIFWVAVFMGGLDVVRTLKDIEAVPVQSTPEPQTWKEVSISAFQRYSRGEIHDMPLRDAEIYDFILCAISIAVAILYHPIVILRKVWAYIALLISFAAFVFWNGGVVLGDKSNHVATIHLPQLLYLSAFTAFFSLPLLIPSIISLLQLLLSPLFPAPVSKPTSPPTPTWKLLLTSTAILGSLLAALIMIHLSTLIHPFTLADNRHYVFYIFRYTILRHPLIRYLLAPIYLICSWLVYRTLCAPASPIPSATPSPSSAKAEDRTTTKLLQQRIPFRSPRPTTAIPIAAPDKNGPSTSFLLVYLLPTALSLITAPLVEPRYFILPWVLWRLHVPSQPPSNPPSHAYGTRRQKRAGGGMRFWTSRTAKGNGYDYRLMLETVYFLVINALTCYVFLYRGFGWVQEPGVVQRFMW